MVSGQSYQRVTRATSQRAVRRDGGTIERHAAPANRSAAVRYYEAVQYCTVPVRTVGIPTVQ